MLVGKGRSRVLGETVGSREIPESWGGVGWEESGKLSHLLRASMAERPEVREPKSEIHEERGCRGTGL